MVSDPKMTGPTMTRPTMTHPTPPAGDGPATVEVEGPSLLGSGYRPYERFVARLADGAGQVMTQSRDILRAGSVVGILPYDPVREAVVLVRQFRLPAYLTFGAARSELVEIVAGGIEAGEAGETAARRECVEEIGLAPKRMVEILRFLPTPGVIDEYATLFLAEVDAGAVPERGGLVEENELIRPFAVPVEAALTLLEPGACMNGYLIIALQWLALNRARLPQLLPPAA